MRGRARPGTVTGTMAGAVEPEEADLLVHRLRLLLQRPGRGGILLDQRRVLLGDLIHLGQRLVDLVDAAGLFGAGAGDVGDDTGDGVDRLNDLAQLLAGAVDQFNAVLDLAGAVVDQVGDVFRRLR